MNIANTDATLHPTDSDRQDASAAAHDTPAEHHHSAQTQAWLSQLVANLNRMAVNEDYRKEIEKKSF
jgi:hypothetical protein